ILAGGGERHAEGETRFGESFVQLGGTREVANRWLPIARAAVEFPEHKFSRGVGGVDLRLGLELFASFVARSGVTGDGQVDLAETVMDAGRLRIVGKNFAVDVGGVGVLPLRLKRLGLNASGLYRGGIPSL